MNLAAAELAGDFFSLIATAHAEFFFAVGAISIEGVDPDFVGFGGEEEPSVAVLATDGLADVLAIDPKLTAAIGTLDEIPPGSEFDHTSEFLQFEE